MTADLDEMRACIRRARTYWTTCHCGPCVIDRSRKRKLQSMGRRYRVPHEVAWSILAEKFAEGWTALAASSACGLDDAYFSRHLARWRRGEQCYLGVDVAARVMRMGRPTKGQVGAEYTRRQLRALAVMGYGLATLAEATGVNFSTLAAIRNGNERVSAAVANAVAVTYGRLHMAPGGDEQARRISREKGWPGPLSWDDIENDPSPSRTPRRRDEFAVDEVVVDQLVTHGRRSRNLTHAEAAEAVRRLSANGVNGRQISKQYGLKPERYAGVSA